MRIGCSTYTPWQQPELPQGVVRFSSHSCSDMGIVPSCGAAAAWRRHKEILRVRLLQGKKPMPVPMPSTKALRARTKKPCALN